MRRYLTCASFALIGLSTGPAMADSDFWKDVLSSGATTASTYLTFKDDKQVLAARDDASVFVASAGQIRGPYLEAALRQARAEHPGLQISDEQLATAILARP
ncbi:DUF2388 domain-containing protein [Pseudomonas sp. LS44]|uniref:DUF2388 domain-containing protein n=1 Tax=Pseudomonas sp. LS44 TaxID=1357074 RepID=UPI00215A17B0|nr:DUF2388 domain-containing protein [Pseudomonas sp. LS44]UVE17615.1 DUF2388 domain-containing protein [Pseudomonas sp. LS44]